MKKNISNTLPIILSLIGILCGIALIICGIFSFSKYEYYNAGHSPFNDYDLTEYNNGFAKFSISGTDYNTISNNNMALAALNTALTVGYISTIKSIISLFMIFFGIMTSCGFGIVFANNINKLNVGSKTIPSSVASSGSVATPMVSSNSTSTVPNAASVPKNMISNSHSASHSWVCKQCNETNTADKMFCKSCGAYK